MSKIGLLIPCTSRNRPEWKGIRDTYLYKMSLVTFLTKQCKQHTYTVYIGYDADDRIFAQKDQQSTLERFSLAFPNVTFQFIQFDGIPRGYLTKMWNVLFRRAYDDGCEYFYQCGDDIVFHTNGWVSDCIATLKEKDGLGLTGPMNNNNRILTQAFVSRKHMEIFGWFFPEEIINWCCDDWYNLVYKPNYFYPLQSHFCSNEGGAPRYAIHNMEKFVDHLQENTAKLRAETENLANAHRKMIDDYILLSEEYCIV